MEPRTPTNDRKNTHKDITRISSPLIERSPFRKRQANKKTPKKIAQVRINLLANGTVEFILKKPPIQNLVLKGAGMRGIAYRGAIKPLYDRGIINNIKRLAGTSAGSIVVLLISLGLTYDEIVAEGEKVDFKSLVKNIPESLEISLLKNRIIAGLIATVQKKRAYEVAKDLNSLDDGEKLLAILRGIIKSRIETLIIQYPKLQDLKINVDKITFSDLNQIASWCPESNIKELTVTGTKLEKKANGVAEYFNFENTPDMEVAFAVAISTRIPYFFKPVEYPKNSNIWYMDGGCSDNFPMEYLNNKPCLTEGVIKHHGNLGQNLTTLGIRIDTDTDIQNVLFHRPEITERYKTTQYKVKDTVRKRITHSETGEAARLMDMHTHHKYAQTTVQISDQGATMAQFDMPQELQKKMISEAEKTMDEWLMTYNQADTLMEYKTYDSFEDMCKDMDYEELEKFCDLLDSKENNTIYKDYEPIDNQGKFLSIARQILRQKPINKSKTNAFAEIHHTLSLELEELKRIATNKKNTTNIYQRDYLQSVLDMAGKIEESGINDKEKARLLLHWSAPVIRNSKTMRRRLKRKANEFKIDFEKINSKYVKLLYDLRLKVSVLKDKNIIQNKPANIEQISAIEKVIETTISEIENDVHLTDEQCAGYLLKKVKPVLNDKDFQSEIKECDLPNRIRDVVESISADIDSEAPFLAGFGQHIATYRNSLIDVVKSNSESELRQFLNRIDSYFHDALKDLVDKNYNEIIKERYFWDFNNLLLIFNESLTIYTSTGEHALISQWKNETAIKLHIALETYMLRNAFKINRTILTEGLAFIHVDYSPDLPTAIDKNKINGWKRFEDKAKKYFQMKDFSEGKEQSLIESFREIVKENYGMFLNDDDWEAEINRMLDKMIIEVNIDSKLETNTIDSKAESNNIHQAKKNINDKLRKEISLVLKEELPPVQPSEETSKKKSDSNLAEKRLDTFYQILSTLHDLANIKEGDLNYKNLMTVREYLLKHLPDKEISTFFNLIIKYNKFIREANKSNEVIQINKQLKRLLSHLPMDNSYVNHFLHAYYYTFVKQKPDGKLIINKHTVLSDNQRYGILFKAELETLAKNKVPLSSYMQAQFCPPQFKTGILSIGANALCPQSHVELAEDFLEHVKQKKNYSNDLNREFILEGLKRALDLGNVRAITCARNLLIDYCNKISTEENAPALLEIITILFRNTEICKLINEYTNDISLIENKKIDNLLNKYYMLNTNKIHKLLQNLTDDRDHDKEFLDKLERLEELKKSSLLKSDDSNALNSLFSTKLSYLHETRLSFLQHTFDKDTNLLEISNSIEKIEKQIKNRGLYLKESKEKNGTNIVKQITDLIQNEYINKRTSKFCNLFRDSLLTELKTILAKSFIDTLNKLPQKDIQTVKNIVGQMHKLNLIIEEINDESKINLSVVPRYLLKDEFSAFLLGEPFKTLSKNPGKTATDLVNQAFNPNSGSGQLPSFLISIHDKEKEFANRKKGERFGKKYCPIFSSGLSRTIDQIATIIYNEKNYDILERNNNSSLDSSLNEKSGKLEIK